ncbi:MAG: glycosyltransferase, partial [Candidatus Omnitrophica bacterium]|nr:glycosyltransferase [Candidatus Omnitrophota bacterium]
MNEKHLLVSIIIANHNGKGLMAECLDSLSRINYPKSRVEIFMVDNRSDDGSVAFIRAKYKNVKIIENEVNNYCRANNLGIAKSGGEYVVLLNNDVRVTDGWLEELVKIMQEDVSVGAATSKLLQDNGTIQNAGLYELPNFYWGERGAGKESKDYDTLTEVDALSGASVIYRKKALDEVGPFDEDFVMFGEDVDMSIRLKGKGWRLVCAPSSVAYHKLHGSCDEAFARDAIEKNRLLLIAKHHPANLSNALFGSGYFSAGEKNQEAGHIFNLMPAVFLKLAKEHDTQAACGVVRETLAELKRIVNYDTDRLEKDLKNILDDLIQTREDRQRCKDDINRLNSELDNIKEEITNLSNKLRDSVDSGLVKDSTIVELEHKLKDYREKTDNLSNKLRDSVDSGLVKDSTIVELEHKLKDYREETDNLSSKLKDSLEARLELENSLLAIYDSEGYRFILKPLWETIRYCRLAFEYFFRKIYAFIFGIAALFMVPVIAFGVFLCIIERIAEGIFAGFLFSSRKKRMVTSFDDLNISVVIPNYNGIGLLKKCLASIYAADGFGDGNYEVLVVDDASVYDVADCIKDEFPKVHVIRNRRNQGFGRSCNKGVSRAEGELIVLLNNDIIVSKDFLEPLKAHFKDEDVFAVAPKLYYWDRKTFNYGMQMGRFKDGYLNLWNEAETGNGDRVAETAPTVFAVGGAMVFRKNDFLWLGGFDDIYRPNCWEDIDISYRAQKRGLKVLYEPKSLVFHKGGATVNYVRHKEIKNELLFMWKNITDDRMLISHLAHLPGFLYRGKHSSRVTFLRGYLWAVDHLIPALINRFRERAYLEVSDKRILDKCMLYYRNFKRNNYIYQRKKTILLITPFILYPLNCGGKLRIYNLYKRLAKNYNLVLLSLIHHADEVKHIPFLKEIFNEVYAIHTKTHSNDIFFPERYKYSFSSFLIERMNEIQERLPVDIVHIESNELLYLTEYVKHIPVVYTEHDISIISYRSSYYHRGLFDSLSSFVDYLKLVYYHSAIYKNIDHVITLSKQDQKVIDAFSPQAVSSLIPTGVDLEHFKFVEKSAETKSLIFVGHYPHYPNEEAAVYFCHEILPLIRKAMPEVTVKLIGSCPTEEVIKLSRIKGVELIGEVADVNPYLRDASCFVTAFKRSAGIRGKVLEAMACGAPVVSTTRGAYG